MKLRELAGTLPSNEGKGETIVPLRQMAKGSLCTLTSFDVRVDSYAGAYNVHGWGEFPMPTISFRFISEVSR